MKYYQKKSKGFKNKKLNTNSELISRSKEKELQDEETRALQFMQKGEFERAEHIYKKLMSLYHIILNNLAAILGIRNMEDEMRNHEHRTKLCPSTGKGGHFSFKKFLVMSMENKQVLR